jgi:hypothetical protein
MASRSRARVADCKFSSCLDAVPEYASKLVLKTLSASDQLHFVEASVTNVAAIVAGIRQSRKHKYERLRSSTSRVWPVHCVTNHTNKPCRLVLACNYAECNAVQQG